MKKFDLNFGDDIEMEIVFSVGQSIKSTNVEICNPR